MGGISIVGADLAKNVFQVHGAAADGFVIFRKKLSRPQFGAVHGAAAAMFRGDGGLRERPSLGAGDGALRP